MWFDIPVKDIKRAANFYEKTFDFKLEDVKNILDTSLQEMMIIKKSLSEDYCGCLIKTLDDQNQKEGIILYFKVKNLDEFESKLKNSNIKILSKISKSNVGHHVMKFLDTEGNVIGVYS